jgi:hypothetical protein
LPDDDDVKYRLQLIFRRKGGPESQNTRLFEAFPFDAQGQFLRECSLEPGELPIIAHFGLQGSGYLFTTRRIMWFNKQRRSIALSNIRRVSSPVKTVEEKRASDKVILQAENGDHFILNTDPGLPRRGISEDSKVKWSLRALRIRCMVIRVRLWLWIYVTCMSLA